MVVEEEILPGLLAIGDNLTARHDTLLSGLNAAAPGASVPNSEGMFYCVFDKTTNEEAFFWVPNCNVLQASTLNYGLCDKLTDSESTMGGKIGYVVDNVLTETEGKMFVRYAFNETHAVKTSVQPIMSGGFSCSQRPWYQESFICSDPAKVRCPTYFEGSEGLGTFQTYGTITNGVAVAQDIAGWQLCECVADMNCDGSDWRENGSVQLSLLSSVMSLFCWTFIANVWLG